MHRLGFIFCQIILGNIDAIIALVRFFVEKFLVKCHGVRQVIAGPLLNPYTLGCGSLPFIILSAMVLAWSLQVLNRLDVL